MGGGGLPMPPMPDMPSMPQIPEPASQPAQAPVAPPAMTYEATPHDAPGLTSKHYLGQLISGARQHGLPPDYVTFLEAFKTLD